jgi:predicted DNA-binding ribbon-helix-helix protein
MSSSLLLNRNVIIAGRRTSMKLEPDMWEALEEICRRETLTVNQVCTEIAKSHNGNNLTAAIRVFILGYYRAAATDEGHVQAGHGRSAGALVAAIRGRKALPLPRPMARGSNSELVASL